LDPDPRTAARSQLPVFGRLRRDQGYSSAPLLDAELWAERPAGGQRGDSARWRRNGLHGFLCGTGTKFQPNISLSGSFTSIESNTNSSYHSFQAQLDKRLAAGIQFTTAYTWSHAIDEVSDVFDLAGTRAIAQNSLNRVAERGDATFDVRHRFASSIIWDLPFARTNVILGGWQLATIVTLQTGQPFTLYSGFDVNLDGNLTDRLSSTAGITAINEGAERYRVPLDFATQRSLLAAVGTDGAVARNTFRAPGIANVDLSVNKHFRFTERRAFELRVEFFNLFNRPHFGTPVNQLGFSSVGRSVDTTVPARMIQLAGRIYF
jgi:hypothetical protein